MNKQKYNNTIDLFITLLIDEYIVNDYDNLFLEFLEHTHFIDHTQTIESMAYVTQKYSLFMHWFGNNGQLLSLIVDEIKSKIYQWEDQQPV